MDIRPATTAEAGAVAALSAGLFAEDAGRRDPTMNVDWPAQEGAAYFRDVITDPDAVCLVAPGAPGAPGTGGPVGYLVGRSVPPSSLRRVRGAELESMYVRPGDRSGGVGTRLVGAFLRWAAAGGAHHVTVTAYAANRRALAFYRRAGFGPHSVTLRLTPPGRMTATSQAPPSTVRG